MTERPTPDTLKRLSTARWVCTWTLAERSCTALYPHPGDTCGWFEPVRDQGDRPDTAEQVADLRLAAECGIDGDGIFRWKAPLPEILNAAADALAAASAAPVEQDGRAWSAEAMPDCTVRIWGQAPGGYLTTDAFPDGDDALAFAALINRSAARPDRSAGER